MKPSKAPPKPDIHRDLESLDPYYRSGNKILSIVWRWGFLMGFLNSLFEESNWVQWKWRRHIESRYREE